MEHQHKKANTGQTNTKHRVIAAYKPKSMLHTQKLSLHKLGK
ncbi:hypothetical protein [Microscilla marina]|uniref:Uncharacterized protein n=1 Tax=Microscilla marina ATCC 23134 TaxID=313606 RepID=A1ZSW1_MICM2|nr:hypothetical protein [Microscilla marina]EAY26525.1 hypothetical protein M23134_01695 [Microscilla marina ATCC 23134]